MRKDIKKEMRWFVLKLIDIRNNLNRTPDHVADIEFYYQDIISQESIFGITSKPIAQKKVKEMLDRIKNDGEFLNSFYNFNEKRLQYKVLSNGNVKIIGYQTKLLTAYLKENILRGERIFDLTSNSKGQSVLTIYGEETEEKIESREQINAFYLFRKNPSKTIHYPELFEEFKKGMLHDGEYYAIRYPTINDKVKFVQDTVYNLKRKLLKTSKKYDIDINKVLKTIPKKGYEYYG